MWKYLNLSSSKYFFKLEFSEDGKDITFSFTNIKKIWKEVTTITALSKRVKTLNRLIKFNEDTIKETIQRNDPESVEFKNNELFLKYKVDDDPFKFNWNLSELPEEEFQQSFTNPLMFCVEALSKENYKLKEIIEKKDQEIEQFKLEGAVLRRTTVATVPFDTKAYDKRDATVTAITKDFTEIAKTIDFVQTKLREYEQSKSPETAARSPSKNSPSNKSKKRSLKSKLYSERVKRLKQSKAKSQYEDSDSEEELPRNGKNDSSSSSICSKIQDEETEISKIRRDLEILNQQIKEDLAAKKRRSEKGFLSSSVIQK